MIRKLIARGRAEGGFALIEVLIASTVLAVGLLAVIASFSTGYLVLNRANTEATATLLADKTMESYRGKQFSALPAGGTVSVPYTSTVPYSASTTPPSPDGNPYTVTTTEIDTTATNTTTRTMRVITVTVKDGSGRQWAIERSTFDSLGG
jgi:prepilin-type N-terminal cleavage/methylation domain-containing protein